MSEPLHMSWIVYVPALSPGTLAKLNVFVAALLEVLIINTCVPFDDVPE